MAVEVLAGITRGPVAGVLATVFVLGGVLVLTNGLRRWSEAKRARSPLRIGGGMIVIGFGVYLIVLALK